MSDVIQLLPDSVANQIAAGEVIQRPASAVKELLENAVDAGSTIISLVIKDAGKTLIQVNDNGVGMSSTDARLCFERHATSKISSSDDLFKIKTKGFRGEALASIAAISQVELRTKRQDDELGTKILIEASNVREQEQCATSVGTSFSLKNLFYNVPARRNFLKSNPVEVKHIIDEFQRIALVHSNIAFSMHNNGNEVFNLKVGSFRQRIVSIFGDRYNKKLVPIDETTDMVEVEGFVTKPEFAKKTRGEQYFFVNNRFIKNAYLNHAVQNAFDQLLTKDQYPSYFLKLTINPEKIDINIHPTKTEIKFEDERAIYAIIRTAVKQALGKFNIAPSLDFEQETTFNVPLLKETDTIKSPKIKVNPDYNPFEIKTAPFSKKKTSAENWESLYESFEKDTSEIVENNDVEKEKEPQHIVASDWDSDDKEEKNTLVQLHSKYILAQLKSRTLIIDQQRAHERVLYEKFAGSLKENASETQQLLFPENVDFGNSDAELIDDITAELQGLGFDINKVGRTSFVLTGVPAVMGEEGVKGTLENLLEQYKLNESELKLDKNENIAIAMARGASIKSGKRLTKEEMQGLIDQLFACEMPYSSPTGKPTVVTLNLEDLNRQFDY